MQQGMQQYKYIHHSSFWIKAYVAIVSDFPGIGSRNHIKTLFIGSVSKRRYFRFSKRADQVRVGVTCNPFPKQQGCGHIHI